jgi:endonuclease/exonuclease/phosphatase family metal-dependent hydrolase
MNLKHSAAFLILLCVVSATPTWAAEEFNFVAYNLKNYLKMDRRVNGDLKKDAPKPAHEISQLIKIIVAAKPAVLGISEMGTLDDFSDFKEKLAAAGLNYPHGELTLAADPVRHVALLSRYPIVSRNSQTSLTYRIGNKLLPFQRGILDVTIRPAKNYRLRCLGIHLKSKRELEDTDQALMRRNEAELLRSYIDGILKQSPTTNLLVFGDFNDTRNELPIKVIRGRYGSPAGLTDIQLSDDRGERWTYYWRYADQYSRFDFIFASKGLLPEINKDQSHIPSHPNWFTASDHRPLLVKILAEER